MRGPRDLAAGGGWGRSVDADSVAMTRSSTARLVFRMIVARLLYSNRSGAGRTIRQGRGPCTRCGPASSVVGRCCPPRGEFGGQQVSRQPGDEAEHVVHLELPLARAAGPVLDHVEVAQGHVHLRGPAPEEGTAVQQASPRPRRVNRPPSGERRQVDPAAVVEAEVPVAVRVADPERASRRARRQPRRAWQPAPSPVQRPVPEGQSWSRPTSPSWPALPGLENALSTTEATIARRPLPTPAVAI